MPRPLPDEPTLTVHWPSSKQDSQGRPRSLCNSPWPKYTRPEFAKAEELITCAHCKELKRKKDAAIARMQ